MAATKTLEDFKSVVPSMNWYVVRREETLDEKANALIEFINKYHDSELIGEVKNPDISKVSYQQYELYAKVGYSRVELSVFLTRESVEANEYEMFVLNRIFPIITGKATLEEYRYGSSRAGYTIPAAEPTDTKVEMIKQFLSKHTGKLTYVQHTKLGELVTNNYLPVLDTDILSSYEVNVIGSEAGRQNIQVNLVTEPNTNRREIEELKQVIQPIKDAMPADMGTALRNL